MIEPKIDLPPISACARCEYDLRAQQDIGRCPECGLDFSPDDVVVDTSIVGQPSIKRQLLIFAAITCFANFAGFAWMPLLFLPGLLGMIYIQRQNGRFGMGRLALRIDGVSCYENGERKLNLPWERVKEVRQIRGWNRRWGILIRFQRRWWAIGIPCTKDRAVADAVMCQIEKLRSKRLELQDRSASI